jgi:hypothetical protein
MNLSRQLCILKTAKYRIFSWVPASCVCDGTINVITSDKDAVFGILQSSYHVEWSLKLGTKLEDRPRYTPTTAFETFPWPMEAIPSQWNRMSNSSAFLDSVSSAATRLTKLRDAWLRPPELTRIEREVAAGYPDRVIPVDANAAVILKTRTLTSLYNQRPAWLDAAHLELDASVAEVYGWPRGIEIGDALSRLVAMNAERSALEAAAS